MNFCPTSVERHLSLLSSSLSFSRCLLSDTKWPPTRQRKRSWPGRLSCFKEAQVSPWIYRRGIVCGRSGSCKGATRINLHFLTWFPTFAGISHLFWRRWNVARDGCWLSPRELMSSFRILGRNREIGFRDGRRRWRGGGEARRKKREMQEGWKGREGMKEADAFFVVLPFPGAFGSGLFFVPAVAPKRAAAMHSPPFAAAATEIWEFCQN